MQLMQRMLPISIRWAPCPNGYVMTEDTQPAGVHSKHGSLLSQEFLFSDRWKEYFQEVFNRPAPLYQIKSGG